MRSVTDLDIVFISYDEPIADELFDHLRKISPRPPLRIHGVKGFDSALKAAATVAKTERFIAVNGDNRVRELFFRTSIDPSQPADLVWSFNARSVVTGLVYGNGSVKIWPRDLVLRLNTHENAPDGGNDFCWTYRYWQVDEIASDVYHAQSPFHAFRSAYREAIKLSLIRDKKAASWAMTLENAYPPNLSRLLVWLTVGNDWLNGGWSINGARLGWYDLWIENIDPDRISDHTWLRERWANALIAENMQRCLAEITKIWMPLPDLDAVASQWFKAAYINTPRSGLMLPDMKAPA